MTRATRTTRVQGRRHSVDWGGHVHLTFSTSCFWDWCKSRAHKTRLIHAGTTASSSSAMLEQARLDTLVTTYVSCRDVTWRAKWNLGLCVPLLFICSCGQTAGFHNGLRDHVDEIFSDQSEHLMDQLQHCTTSAFYCQVHSPTLLTVAAFSGMDCISEDDAVMGKAAIPR